MANLGKSVKGKNKKKKEEKVEKVITGKAKRVFEVDMNKRLAALNRRLLRVRAPLLRMSSSRLAVQCAVHVVVQDALNRERDMSKWNMAKIQNAWRKILRLAKVRPPRVWAP